MNRIHTSPGNENPDLHPEVLKRIIATLARNAGGEIRLTALEERAMLAIYVDESTREYVVRVSDVPWPHQED